jgi:ssDNA-binding Zn-finger/Zn-ribbon topoisomerase 1
VESEEMKKNNEVGLDGLVCPDCGEPLMILKVGKAGGKGSLHGCKKCLKVFSQTTGANSRRGVRGIELAVDLHDYKIAC